MKSWGWITWIFEKKTVIQHHFLVLIIILAFFHYVKEWYYQCQFFSLLRFVSLDYLNPFFFSPISLKVFRKDAQEKKLNVFQINFEIWNVNKKVENGKKVVSFEKRPNFKFESKANLSWITLEYWEENFLLRPSFLNTFLTFQKSESTAQQIKDLRLPFMSSFLR